LNSISKIGKLIFIGIGESGMKNSGHFNMVPLKCNQDNLVPTSMATQYQSDLKDDTQMKWLQLSKLGIKLW